MKNIHISGVCWFQHEVEKKEDLNYHKTNVCYNVQIWGQSPDNPEIEFIKGVKMNTGIGYNELMRKARDLYCNYFHVNDGDIRVFANITNLHNQEIQDILS